MLPADFAPYTLSLAGRLRELAELTRRLNKQHFSARITAAANQLRAAGASDSTGEVLDAGVALVRRLYSESMVSEATIVADALVDHASASPNPVHKRRARMLCGIAHTEAGDPAGAIEHHAAALRLAIDEDNGDAISRTWNNLGLVVSNSGQYELAIRCFERALAVAGEGPAALATRYLATCNTANCYSHLGLHEQGLDHAMRGLVEESAQFRQQDPHAALFLRRNLVNALAALGRIGDAERYVVQASELAEFLNSPRGFITNAITRSLFELARGSHDMALTRLESTLEKARAVPGALRDTLACLARAEEAAGNAARALLRLQELAEHVYRSAIEVARAQVEIAAMGAAATPVTGIHERQFEARLHSRVPPPHPPTGWAAVERLAVSACLRQETTGWHGKRVGALVKALALAQGTNPLQALELGLAAEVHDIGMLSVPEGILSKRAPLNEAEGRVVRRHAEAGIEMLGTEPHPRLLLAREMNSYHHARWDGQGHPNAVRGMSIPLCARMCAIADAYDAMVCGVGHRKPRSMDSALEELRREAGGQFDPALVTAFEVMLHDESQDIGVEISAGAGMEDFQQFIQSLQEDRGFV
ncbi:MAG TPA: HD domain-containing phosphohydrolase [Usitatibacter sp.]|nr:HD domain-containing phosphohydrolase [Usitatibacter sp.]